jgi:hypothetical protein
MFCEEEVKRLLPVAIQLSQYQLLNLFVLALEFSAALSIIK